MGLGALVSLLTLGFQWHNQEPDSPGISCDGSLCLSVRMSGSAKFTLVMETLLYTGSRIFLINLLGRIRRFFRDNHNLKIPFIISHLTFVGIVLSTFPPTSYSYHTMHQWNNTEESVLIAPPLPFLLFENSHTSHSSPSLFSLHLPNSPCNNLFYFITRSPYWSQTDNCSFMVN